MQKKREGSGTNSLENGRRAKLAQALVAHSHQAVLRVLRPAVAERRRSRERSIDGGDAGDGDRIGEDVSGRR